MVLKKIVPKILQRWWIEIQKKLKCFKEHVKAHWPRYVLSLVTATFTYHAGYSMTNTIYYGLMAILLSEGMWMYWLSRIESYENGVQLFLAVVMFLLGSGAIITTDIASAILIANQNNTAALYSILPSWVEEYITKVIPILAASNLIVYGLYEFFSETNKDKRFVENKKRETERFIKKAEQDMKRMRAQGRILTRKQQIQKLEQQQIKKYGKKLVSQQKAIAALPWWKRIFQWRNK